jgi:hypothetical protein
MSAYVAGFSDENTENMVYRHHPDWVPMDTLPESAMSEFAGKIVFVLWWEQNPMQMMADQNFRMVSRLQSVTESLVHQSYYVPMAWLNYVLVVIVLAFSIAMFAKYPLRRSVLLILALGVLLFATGTYATAHWHLIMRSGYALLASLLCASVLPYIRLVHERSA